MVSLITDEVNQIAETGEDAIATGVEQISQAADIPQKMAEVVTNTAANLADTGSEKLTHTLETFIDSRAGGLLEKIESWTGIPANYLMTGKNDLSTYITAIFVS